MSGKSLFNKVIVVTGGSGGIGNAIVRTLSDSGAEVISVFCKNCPSDQTPEKITLFRADLTKSDDWSRLLSFVQKRFGKIDALINCAGYLQPGRFSSLGEIEIKKMIDINFTSTIIGIHKTLELFKKQGSGHIINIGSLGGIVPMPWSSVYSAAKFGLRGFTLSLVEELRGTGIKISLVSPGPVITNMLNNEALDENAAISFVTNPQHPRYVAKEVLKLICKPRIESIIPAGQSFISRLLTLSPFLFSKCYRIVHKIGLKKKRVYLNRYGNFNLSEVR